MIKFKTKINLKHIKYRLDICEQNIETLNNILNLKYVQIYINMVQIHMFHIL